MRSSSFSLSESSTLWAYGCAVRLDVYPNATEGCSIGRTSDDIHACMYIASARYVGNTCTSLRPVVNGCLSLVVTASALGASGRGSIHITLKA